MCKERTTLELSGKIILEKKLENVTLRRRKGYACPLGAESFSKSCIYFKYLSLPSFPSKRIIYIKYS